jgi:DNA polymerase
VTSRSNKEHCGVKLSPEEWGAESAEAVIRLLNHRDLVVMEKVWGNAQKAITSSIRGFLIASPGHDLICSDYSAIEARVIAAMAGEEWRLEVFRTHGMIYEMSASKITGIPFDEYLKHKKETGQHHPTRKTLGKPGELGSGFGGGIGAWKNFGADKYLSDKEILDGVRKWREASPMVVKFWREVEAAAVKAVKSQGTIQRYRDVSYQVRNNVLYCKLPSGRELTYHSPWITVQYVRWEETGRLTEDGEMERVRCDYPYPVEGSTPADVLNHMATPRKGGGGTWVKCRTWGGTLVENIVQATARDLLADALLRLDKAGYPVIMHVHDEIIAEVPHGFGSVEEFEAIMEQTPHWAAGWPIKADGGWRGLRYRK